MPKEINIGVIITHGPLKGGGGVQRRFARAFNYLTSKNSPLNCYLIGHSGLLKRLEESSIRINKKNVILVSELDMVEKKIKSNFFLKNILISIRLSVALIKVVKDIKLNIVHFLNANHLLIPFLIWLKIKKVKIVLSMVASPPWDEVFESSLKKKIVWNIFFKFSDVIDSLYRSFGNIYSQYSNKIRVTPCSFTDYNQFYPHNKEKLIVFAGRFESRKNPILFIDSIIGIQDEIRKYGWKCLMLGCGELEGMLRNKVKKAKIYDILTITSLWDISEVLNKSLIFVSLQKGENYPSQSLLEAMASGNTIIATDVGDTRRLINDENGFLLTTHDPLELSQIISYLIKKPKLCSILGRNARQYVLSHHRLEIMSEYLKNLWLDVAKKY